MTVATTTDELVTTIMISRAERANALDSATVAELKSAVEASYATTTPVVVITGAGARCFVGGADLRELGGFDAAGAERFIRSLHEALQAVREHPRPVIAAVNGHALGAGLELVLSCDIAIAADHAEFGMPEVKIGVPSVIEGALMPISLGLMRTRQLLLTGDKIDAAEAERIGLVNEVVAAASLDEAVRTMAARLAANAPRALTLQKQLMNRWLNLPMDQAIDAGIEAFAAAYETDEPRQTIAEFWRGRGR
ncbi:MAG: enoyl-CoA hydratase-related protein [Acidimicrobiia bacterium]